MRVAATMLLFASLAACGPKQLPASGAGEIVSVAPRALGEPAPRAAPASIHKCVLETAGWPQPDYEPAALRLADGRPFARALGGAAARVELSAADSDGVPAVFRAAGAHLRAEVALRDLPLHLTHAVVFEGFAVPRGRARLWWAGVSHGKLRVAHELRGWVASDRLHAEVACSDLSLEPGHFDPVPAELGKRRGRSAQISPEVRVPLAATPGGSPLAWIDGQAEDAGGDEFPLQELRFEHGQSRVLWERSDEILFGWLPGRFLETVDEGTPPPPAYEEPQEAVGLLAAEERDPEQRRCSVDIPLSVRFDADAALVDVGVLKAGSRFLADAESYPDVAIVTLPQTFYDVFQLEDGVELVTTHAALAACHSVGAR